MNTELMKLAKIWAKALYKLRKDFRKAMGKKTIKINSLQHCKLTLLKSKLNYDSGHKCTLGDVIEFLIDYYNDGNEAREKFLKEYQFDNEK